MRSWSETIRLPHRLRDVRLAGIPAKSYSEEQVRTREQQSFERGRREAEEAVKNEIGRERSELSKLKTELLESFRQTMPQVARDSENALIALALEVARKLVGDLPLSVDLVEAAIREALLEVEENSELTILLHPADLELLQACDSSLIQATANGERVQFGASTEVTRGGCLVRTTFGVIDGRRETKFELLKQALAA